MIDRRAFLGTLTGGLLAAPATMAQQARKVYRLGLLSPTPALFLMEPFAVEMRERGWAEAQHFTMERRFTGAKPDSATDLARELVDLQVDVIVTVLTGNAVAARRASRRLPIVMVTSGYPVEAGLASSLAKPGGNVTGNSIYVGGEVFGKYLELLKTLSPQMTRLGVLWDYLPPMATEEEVALSLGEFNRVAPRMGIAIVAREVRVQADVNRALAAFSKDGVGALFVSSGPVHGQSDIAARIAEFAARRRIPTMSDFAGGFFTRAGMMAYSANPGALGRRAAYFVDRILRGTDPGDLPIERPSKFDLVINLKTAKVLGLTIPPSLLARADQVIE